MIRINLLPQKRRHAAAADGRQVWLLLSLLVVIAEVVALFVFHGMKQEELDRQLRTNTELDAQIKQARAAVSDHAQIRAKLARLRDREDAISKLQSARTGPTAVLLELARLLTTGRGPSLSPHKLNQLRRDNPLAVYNPHWDARRLWLTQFVERQRGVRLEGVARDGEDVSELARRMTLSTYFTDVRLLPARKEKVGQSGLEMVRFQLEAQVRY